MKTRIKIFLKAKIPEPIFKFLKKIHWPKGFYKIFNIDLNEDYRNTIILAGTGRSGTTWVANILNYNKRYRYMDEPFHPRRVRLIKKIGGIPYLRPEDKNENIHNIISQVISGRIRSIYINRHNSKYISNKRLIKDIHISIILKWIKINFPEIPLILLLRHPFAVAYSRARLKWWDADAILIKYLRQDKIVEDFLTGKTEIVKNLKDDFLKFVFIWCIENIIPLRQLNESEIHLVFYENLCRHPEKEAKKMFDFIGCKMADSIVPIFNKPSQVTTRDSAILNKRDLVTDWQHRINKSQISEGMNILKSFGLDKIYSGDPLPNTEEAYRFLSRSNL